MTELQIINAMLKAIKQMPVSRADSSHPFAITARETLDGINEEVQSEGIWFNKVKGLRLTPDESGKITLPDTVLSIDSIDRSQQLIQRGSVLYDGNNLTDIFTSDVYVDIIFLIDIESIPTTAANYIKRRCVYEYFLDKDGEVKKLAEYEKLMNDAYMRFGAEKIRYADTNLADNPQFSLFMGRFSAPEFGTAGTDKKVWVRK